jgi:hypothetical protein
VRIDDRRRIDGFLKTPAVPVNVMIWAFQALVQGGDGAGRIQTGEGNRGKSLRGSGL